MKTGSKGRLRVKVGRTDAEGGKESRWVAGDRERGRERDKEGEREGESEEGGKEAWTAVAAVERGQVGEGENFMRDCTAAGRNG